ncbi:hypothetical protein [Shivajiella indica]|uniref:Outer membrane protein beta-barrel domain-containing protein n=1 Tax=Shivajiella indica TaxID=872115 RepID=A0ABW5BAD7_9BACT
MKNRYIIPVFCIFVLSIFQAKGQEDFKRNTVFGELGGSSFLVSINYDKRLSKSSEGFGVRVGAGYMAWQDTEIFNFPILVNYLAGNNGKYFEMGIGPTFGYAQERQEPMDPDLSFEPYMTVFGSINIGYRYQPLNGGFNFRAGISPILDFGDVIPFWPYLSFGYSF